MTTNDLNLAFLEISQEDLPDITAVMTRAFDDDAQKHLGQERGGPEGYDNGDFFRKWLFGYQESVGYKIISGENIVGAIIVWILPEGHNILGTIFVDPPFQDQGIGEQTWKFIENTYPDTKSWRLGTPNWAIKNHHFYSKCGFHKVETDPLIPAEEDITIYRKEMSAGP